MVPLIGLLIGCSGTPVANNYTESSAAILLGDYLYAFGESYSFKNEALTGVKINFTDTENDQNSCTIATSEVNKGKRNTKFRFEIICEYSFSYFDLFEQTTFEYKRAVNYNFYWINFATRWNAVSSMSTLSTSSDEKYELKLTYPGITYSYPATITPYYPRVVLDTTEQKIIKLDEFTFFEGYFNESVQIINRWLLSKDFSILNFKTVTVCC
jgi:hypothetical protein